jgi:hypothetical protein
MPNVDLTTRDQEILRPQVCPKWQSWMDGTKTEKRGEADHDVEDILVAVRLRPVGRSGAVEIDQIDRAPARSS